MQAGAADHQPAAAALFPAVMIAAVVLVVALVISGARGTIVLEKVTFSSDATRNGQANSPIAVSVTEISQAAADGTLQREFSSSLYGPG